eukprot:PhF_6_TR14591/c0_g1_i1/m.23094
MATFSPAYFGLPVVRDEGPDAITPIRIFFVVSTLILGCVCTTWVLRKHFCSNISRNADGVIVVPRQYRALYYHLLVSWILHMVIHTAHYADNILRPVDYFEPQWLY